VLKIALPIVLSNATVPLLGAVDTGVVGQMGMAAPIGAVGIGAIILAAIYWVFGFLRMGTTGLAAQARGAGDRDEVAAILSRALLIAGAAGLVFVAAQTLLFAGAFAVAPASDEVETLARQYLAIRIWGAPATIALYAVTGWLIAAERTRGVLVLQLWMNGLNVGLDLWFVLGLGWGVAGRGGGNADRGMVGPRARALAVPRRLCGHGLADGGPRVRPGAAVADDRGQHRHHDPLGPAAGLFRGLPVPVGGPGRRDAGRQPGAAPVPGDHRLCAGRFRLRGRGDGGQRRGRRPPAGRPAGVGRRVAMGRGGGRGAGVAFWLAGPRVIDLMTTAPDVRDQARAFLPWVVAGPVLGIASWMYDGIYIGATWTRAMRNAMVQSVAVFAVAVVVLPAALGAHGLWAALMVLNVLRGVTLGLRYPRLEATVGRAERGSAP
jgi:multidrug resistance protein, MATE family